MSFDKIKAMRSAERFLSQGKLRSALNEYKRVVEDNPKDFSTLNIMGDLYVKNLEYDNAVRCYRQVADHYNRQGFANKAIAIFSKIARLQPDSIEVTGNLAQLYQMRGSYAEAREHYQKLGDFYRKKGQKIEALAIWKKIAELDPNDTEVYLNIAEAYLNEKQTSDAVDAYAEAGLRFNTQGTYESAIAAFTKALEIQPDDLKTLNGFVAAKIALECADDAAEYLEKILADNPYNRDLLNHSVKCYLHLDDAAKAEKTVITLVHQDAVNYPKFLEVVDVYMKKNDLESSVRVLSISFEHLLGAGYSEQFLDWIDEILARNPEHIEALRLLVRYYSWHRNDAEIRKSLERLAETARLLELVEDERYALGQLSAMSPLETEYTERLQELRKIHGLEDAEIIEEESEVPVFETFAALNEDDEPDSQNDVALETFEAYGGDSAIAGREVADLHPTDISVENNSSEAMRDFEFIDEKVEINLAEITISADEFSESYSADDFNSENYEEPNLQKEIESIEFYLYQGYKDLALTTLNNLVERIGEPPDLVELRQRIAAFKQTAPQEEAAAAAPEAVQIISVEETQSVQEKKEELSPKLNVFEQFKSDLGLEDEEKIDKGDYATHYQMATAYKEMGLMEDAIKEFQSAISLVQINDEARQYFQCANLLGHCFMMKGMPKLAQTWFNRALETKNLDDQEIQALNYELANAYEADGEKDKAFEYFEQVYALDVDFRDIGQRIQNLRGSYSSSMVN